MSSLLYYVTLCCICTTTLLADPQHDHRVDHQPAFIHDPETGQDYPISTFSLAEDPKYLLPDPDPTLFPPEYLQSLLLHCDDPTPSYVEFFQKAWIAFNEIGLNFTRYPFHPAIAWRILQAAKPIQLISVVCIAFVITILRYISDNLVFKPLTRYLGVPAASAAKLPESAWKAFWFLILWLCSLRVLMLTDLRDFHYPLRLFKGLRFEVGYFDIPVPWSYYCVYLLQMGFYLHCFYCVLFLDSWMKDSKILVVHHALTLFLLQFSLILRLHRVGVLVVFLHDLNDIFLEFGKVHLYLKYRRGQYYQIHETIATSCFITFTLSWAVTRLYWFPLKVLYAASWGAYIALIGREGRCVLFFNIMLWMLFAMHIYWFCYIVKVAWRLLTGKMTSLVDIRDYDMDEQVSAKKVVANVRRSKHEKKLSVDDDELPKSEFDSDFGLMNGVTADHKKLN